MGLSTFDETSAYWKLDSAAADDVGHVLTIFDTVPGRTRIDDAFAATNSSTDLLLELNLVDSHANHTRIATVTVVAFAGDVGLPAIDLLAACPVPVRAGMPLDVGSTITATIISGGDAGTTISTIGSGGLV